MCRHLSKRLQAAELEMTGLRQGGIMHGWAAECLTDIAMLCVTRIPHSRKYAFKQAETQAVQLRAVIRGAAAGCDAAFVECAVILCSSRSLALRRFDGT